MATKKKDDSRKSKGEEAASASIPLFAQLEEALKKVPTEKLKEAKSRVSDLMKGDLKWTELFDLSPEKLKQMGEVAYEQFKSGSYASAEKILKGLTVIDPDNYYYHQVLGAAYQRQNKFSEAVLEYSVAIDLNGKDVVSMTNRGESYVKLGLHPLAVKDFDKAIAADESGNDKWANRARMLKEQLGVIEKEKKK
ncbi:MAG: hypothetical protein HYW02_06320 [Deltaproteobacteria bacterium]|nr:hypothetical protein [Deltaproteobacteria bacterium]